MDAPRSLLVTVFGLYARSEGRRALPVAGLVRLLARLDVDEQAVRAAVSRLKRRDLLRSTRVGGAAAYALTPTGERVLAEGDDRIFGGVPDSPTDTWVLCVYTVPESQREKRHLLRRELTWLGFGQAAPGVWVAPSRMIEPTRNVLRRNGLIAYVSLFASTYLGETPTREAVASWWDLPSLAARYHRFIEDFSEMDTDAALSTWVRAVTHWRRLPYLDPGLPGELLPDDWPGHAAWRLFGELSDRLTVPAEKEAQRLLSGPNT
ncbi:PaaX family transcriptional regulator C-terminal domain-containing protein [Stackebrandtia soli]|uniref:PaaX family transcriptional regulator n=1 Tax=Stackebrandtia soli TaxID=1892856 RepID=UPI0039ECBB8C